MDEVSFLRLVPPIEHVNYTVSLARGIEYAYIFLQGPLVQKLTLGPDLEQEAFSSELFSQANVSDFTNYGRKMHALIEVAGADDFFKFI